MANQFLNSVKQRLLPKPASVGGVPGGSGGAPLDNLSLSQILAPGGSHTISDIAPNYWFGPLQPVRPVAPSTYRPRQFAYTPGSNILWQPKAEDAITFETLRALADSWDLLRIAIEQQKDRLVRTKFEIRARMHPGEKKSQHLARSKDDDTLKQLNDWMRSPDGIHPFRQWLRMVLEDMIVIDAVALYQERDLSGKIASVHPIAGDTISRMLTEQGFIPPPPSIAYQQVVYGSPACDFTTNDLIYFMRNERTNRRYGYSPVEQILMTISIALRRQQFQLEYYTSGNMPEALCFLPPNLSVDRIKEIQEWFDSIMSGDLARRRRMTFLPGWGSEDGKVSNNIVFSKEPLLKDEMDEWLARIACACIGISYQAFVKMMNRASGEQAQDTSESEGQEPYLLSIEDILNQQLMRFGMADKYEAMRTPKTEPDPLKQAQVDELLVGKIYTINQILERRGEDKRSEPEADMLGEFTPTGFIPLKGAADHADAQRSATVDGLNAKSESLRMGKPDGEDPDDKQPVPNKNPKPNGKGKPNGSATANKAAAARGRLHRLPARIDVGVLTHNSQEAAGVVEKIMADVLREAQSDAVRIGGKLLRKETTKFTKADDAPDYDAIVRAIMAAINKRFASIPAEIRPALESAAQSGLTQAVMQIDIGDSSMITGVNDQAKAWSTKRAAELVGMSYDDDGELIPNPDAKWAITDRTRDDIRRLIEEAFDSGEMSAAELQDAAVAAGTFNVSRARLIARTEIARAQVQGHLSMWKASGVVSKLSWSLSEDEACQQCISLSENGPYPIETAPVPIDDSHPQCRCVVTAELSEEYA